MTTKNNAHFVDSDITGTSGGDAWTSDNFSFPSLAAGAVGISTPEEFDAIRDDMSDGVVYELLNDIDLSGFAEWVPLGDWDTAFECELNGNYFSVTGMTQAVMHDLGNEPGGFGSPKRWGMALIGVMTTNALVQKIVIDVNIDIPKGTAQFIDYAGGVVGAAKTNVTSNALYRVKVTGSISGFNAHTGGMVSRVQLLKMEECLSEVNINITDFSNGISHVGSMIGFQVAWAPFSSSQGRSVIDNCYATGSVTVNVPATAVPIRAGGFIGRLDNHFTPDDWTNCYASGNVSTTVKIAAFGDAYAGGFIGDAHRAINSLSGEVINCFGFGTVAGVGGTTFVGGFIGDMDTASQPDETNTHYKNNGNAANSTATQQTDAYFKAAASGVYTGSPVWDFVNVWTITEGVSLPTLQWLTFDPNKIKTGEQNRTTAMPTDYAHLNGQTVQVLGDGSYLGTDVVAAGAIDLDDNTTVNHVGLQYTSTVLPMKIDGEVNIKRVSKIIPNVNETVGGDYGRSVAKLTSMVLRSSGDSLDTDSALFTGHVELPFDGTLDRSGDIYVTQDEPLPMKLLGIGIDYSQEPI